MSALKILFNLLILLFGVSSPTIDASNGRINLWVDTDLACGYEKTADVDDCLALNYLLLRDDISIAGISTIFGNAEEDVVFQQLRNFLVHYHEAYPERELPPVFRGSPGRSTRYGEPPRSLASTEIAEYFSSSQGYVLLLGPATNLVAALHENEAIVQNVNKVLFVGGSEREGRRFFPDENSRLISFRDFNFAKDKYSFKILFESSFPLHFAGYDLASEHLFGPSSLEEFSLREPLNTYLIANVKGWADYWSESFNLEGFYPFDLVAAKSILDPEGFNCGTTVASINSSMVLFFSTLKSLQVGVGKREVVYCGKSTDPS